MAYVSTPLEDPESGKKGSHCGFFKLKVLKDATSDSMEQFVENNVDSSSVLSTDKNTDYVHLEKMVEEHIKANPLRIQQLERSIG